MDAQLAPLNSERLLIEHLPDLPGTSALVISPGRAQWAEQCLRQGRCQQVTVWYLDLYAAGQTAQAIDERVRVVCSADLPEETFDLVAMPVLKRSESELTRDLMQQAYERLSLGGYLAMAVDHPTDHWLHAQLRRYFAKVSCHRAAAGCVYWARKQTDLRKRKNYEAQLTFRDEGQLIHLVSRPGVFAHRKIDAGARQLLLAAEIGPADHVLDMGCGAGTVALAVAKKTTGLVHAVDSNARAIQCVERSAAINGLTNLRPLLNADGILELPSPVDVALANPPYYGDDRIAEHFSRVAIANLRPGGALLVVTKNPRWYHAYFTPQLQDISIFESGNYFVCCGRK